MLLITGCGWAKHSSEFSLAADFFCRQVVQLSASPYVLVTCTTRDALQVKKSSTIALALLLVNLVERGVLGTPRLYIHLWAACWHC